MTLATRQLRCLTCDKEYPATAGMSECPVDGALLASISEDTLLNTLFDEKYLLLEVLGEGAYGRVYKAQHMLMQKMVAVKVLLADLDSVEALDRFQTEARATNKLVHPNIVAVYDYGVAPRPFIVMEYVDGETLDQLVLRDGPLAVEKFISVFEQICGGLSLAHERGLLHRDLKPSNIIVDANTGTPKILDFGVVKIVGEEKTLSGQMVGSPPYMSPEQCMGNELDARADVYSLGCVMYEALSGVRAFDGENAVECMYKHFNVVPPAISRKRKGDLPHGMDYLIAKTMADYPDRYQRMDDLRKDLLKVGEGTMTKRLPKISRVTYRKTVKAFAEMSSMGFFAVVGALIIIWITMSL